MHKWIEETHPKRQYDAYYRQAPTIRYQYTNDIKLIWFLMTRNVDQLKMLLSSVICSKLKT